MRQTAEQRGAAMMRTPLGELPSLAVEFARAQCQRLGGCGEVLLTSWIVYAQCVEGLVCHTALYRSSREDWEWFRRRLANETPAAFQKAR